MEIKKVRMVLGFFIIALLLSGITAIPIDWELQLLVSNNDPGSATKAWLQIVLHAYTDVKSMYPFLLYGYYWLAFAHIILAILFVGPYLDPVKNIWVIQFGMIACVLVFPLAFIAGHFRGIPLGWRLIDCCFGLVGFLPLWICYRLISRSLSKLSYA